MKIECKICNRQFEQERSISRHVFSHKMTIKEYYDKFLKKDNEGICSCGNTTSFLSVTRGYQRFCCTECSNRDNNKKLKIEKTNMQRYGNKCSLQNKLIRKKTTKTLISKYGVDNPSKSPDLREKVRKTNLERYGCEHTTQNAKVQQRIKETNLRRYGKHPSKTKEVKEKRKRTSIKRFGCSSPLQHPEIREKTEKTLVKKYGVTHPFKSEKIKKRYRRTCLKKYGVDHTSKTKHVIQKIKDTTFKNYGVTNIAKTEERITWMKNGGAAHANSFVKNPSKPQKELYELCKTMFPNVVLNYKCLNYSIDIAIPNLQIAIEYDGSYWHQNPLYDTTRQKEIEKQGWTVIRYVDELPSRKQLLIDTSL